MKKRTYISVALTAALIIGACGSGEPLEDSTDGAASLTTATTQTTEASAPPTTSAVLTIMTGLPAIESTARKLVDRDGHLVELMIGAVEQTGTRASGLVTLDITGEVVTNHWPEEETSGDSIVLTANVRNEVASWLQDATGNSILAVIAEGEVLDLASLDGDNDVRVSGYDLGDMLADAPNTDFRNNYLDVCAPPSRPEAELTDLQALIAHFDYYLAHRKASQQNFEAVAEQIVDSATLVDAVTGQSVEPDLNGVIRQLKDGVAESDVTLAPVVQLGIDATNYEGESGVLIFVDQSTVLGWIPISKLPEVIVAEVPTPTTETSPTAYFFAGADIPTIDCPETWIGDAEPVITLDYDLVFDEQRATIDIASYTLRELELPEGE